MRTYSVARIFGFLDFILFFPSFGFLSNVERQFLHYKIRKMNFIETDGVVRGVFLNCNMRKLKVIASFLLYCYTSP